MSRRALWVWDVGPVTNGCAAHGGFLFSFVKGKDGKRWGTLGAATGDQTRKRTKGVIAKGVLSLRRSPC